MTRERKLTASMASNDAGEQMLKLAQAQQNGQKSREIRSLNAKLRDSADEKIVAGGALSRTRDRGSSMHALPEGGSEALQSSDVADDTKQERKKRWLQPRVAAW